MKNSRAVRMTAIVLWAIGALGATACGSTSTSPDTSTSVVGTYALKTVDGSNLPAPAKDDKGVVAGTFTSGSVTLTSTGAFTSTLAYVLTNGTPGTSTGSGTYSVSGSTLTFVASGSLPVVATFSSGNTLSEVSNTQTFVYMK